MVGFPFLDLVLIDHRGLHEQHIARVGTYLTFDCSAGALDLLLWDGSSAQSDDRQFAVGFVLIFRETLCRAGDVAPRLLAGVAV
jgi:hypothetical protein